MVTHMDGLEYLAALTEGLDNLHGRTVEVTVKADKQAEDELLERLVAKLNRSGGPKLSSRAIV